jgi:hypothetical protein
VGGDKATINGVSSGVLPTCPWGSGCCGSEGFTMGNGSGRQAGVVAMRPWAPSEYFLHPAMTLR